MSAETAPAAAAPRRIHPIVELDYGVRRWANLLVFVVLVSHFLERPPPPWAWAVLVFHGFLWAPLARWLACRAPDSRQAEHRNLMVDALLFGALSGLRNASGDSPACTESAARSMPAFWIPASMLNGKAAVGVTRSVLR